MILVDTSVWVDHLRSSDRAITQLLLDGKVATHPYIVGEIALGNLKNRKSVLLALCGLPQVAVAATERVFRIIETYALYGVGIGYVDAQLLAAASAESDCAIWTRDKRFPAAAIRLNLGALAFN